MDPARLARARAGRHRNEFGIDQFDPNMNLPVALEIGAVAYRAGRSGDEEQRTLDFLGAFKSRRHCWCPSCRKMSCRLV